jgi:hypothetical protein
MFATETAINGFAAESMVSACLAGAKCKRVPLPSIRVLVEATASTTFGRQRLSHCESWLMREFSVNGNFSWDYVPVSEFLDRVLGVDLWVNYMGHLIAIDVTVDPTAKTLDSKFQTHKMLRRVYQALGIDKVITLQVSQSGIRHEELREAIKSAIQADGLVLS